MKKLLVLFLTTLIMLQLSACSSDGSEEQLIDKINLGITKNQVIEQLGYSDDYYEEYHGDLTYRDIKIFDQYCTSARFRFEDKELVSVIIHYPSGADTDEIFKVLEKVYGKGQDYSVDSNDTWYNWKHNNASINFNIVDDKPCIEMHKNED